MPAFTFGQENNIRMELYREDHGAGPPVVLIHGYPVRGRACDEQVPALLEAGAWPDSSPSCHVSPRP
jgi:hypothetical protein